MSNQVNRITTVIFSGYRNTAKLILASGEVIDKGSLWRRQGDLLILVDDDRYVEHEITPLFVKE